MQKLEVPQGKFVLQRYPERKREQLRAWDAADELILHHLAEQESVHKTAERCLIVNDSFGALSTALAHQQPHMMSDSWLAMQGTRVNLKANGITEQKISFFSSIEQLDGIYDYILIKIPKSLAQLEEQLYRVRPHMHSNTKLVAAAMVKSIHRSTLELFEQIIGPTHTSLARKKARLVFSEYDQLRQPPSPKAPLVYTLENTNFQIINHASVFSRQGLDIGTRFFIQHIPSSTETRTILDLGCGNGILGLIAAERNPQAHLIFTDESFMAVASAQANFENAFGDKRSASFHVTDSLDGIDTNSVDLVLNNPPFHQHNAVGDSVAWQMFKESKRVLRKGGELWVIGNRHLGYHTKLKRLFGNYRNIASNRKFVILKALKR